VARREKCGGCGAWKFRLAQHRAKLFPAAAAQHVFGWQRLWNSATEGSASAMFLKNNCHQEAKIRHAGCTSGESDRHTVWLEKEEIPFLADEYT